MYLLAKFELCILKAFEVIVLQSSDNRKIDFTHKENKLQAVPKTDVTYEWSEIATDSNFTPSYLPWAEDCITG